MSRKHTLNVNAIHVLQVVEIRLRILKAQVAEKVALMKMVRKCQMIQQDRRRTLNDVGNTLGLSHITFNRTGGLLQNMCPDLLKVDHKQNRLVMCQNLQDLAK
jgi:hypothetical protein